LRFAVHEPGIPEASPRSHGVPRRDIPGRVDVSVKRVSAGNAAEERLTLAALHCDVPARRALLTRERGTYLLDPSGRLMFQPTDELSPTRAVNLPVQPGLLPDVPAWGLGGAPSRADHVPYLEVFDADFVEPPRKVGAYLLAPVPAPVGLTYLELRYRRLDPLAAARPVSRSGQLPLQSPEPYPLSRGRARDAQQFARGQRSGNRHASVDADDRAVTRGRDRTGRDGEPNVPATCSVPGDAIGLRACRNGTGPAETHPAHLRNTHLGPMPVHPTHTVRPELDDPESRTPPGLLLDAQVPHVPGVRAVPEQGRFLFRGRDETVSRHTNIISTGRRERRFSPTFRSAAPLCR
jgi:hypothetical protein